MSSAGLTEIQQKQVSGLVDVASGFNSLSGILNATGAAFASNLQATGLYLENTLSSTGATLEAADVVISDQTEVNTTNLVATGFTLNSGISGYNGWETVPRTGLAYWGQHLMDKIFYTGAILKKEQDALTGEIVRAEIRLDKVSGFLGTVYPPNDWREIPKPPPPYEWLKGVSGKVDELSGNLIATGVILRDALVASGQEWYEWTTGLEGGLQETGRCIGARLGGNSLSASALGHASGYIGTGLGGRTSPQFYEIQQRAEAAIVQQTPSPHPLVSPVDLCSTRIFQWRGVVSESSIYESHVDPGVPAGIFTRERLFLAGDESFGPYYVTPNTTDARVVYMARVPRGSQWSVELIGHARKHGGLSAEGGSFFLNTGFIIGCNPMDYKYEYVENFLYSGIYGISGADGLGGATTIGDHWSDGLGYSFGISGSAFMRGPGDIPRTDIDGFHDMWLDVWAKNYTNYEAEFQVTAYVTALAPFFNEYTRPYPFH